MVGGIITRVKKIITKRGNNEMAFARVGDLTASVEVVVFPRVFSRTKRTWKVDNIAIIKGRVEEKERGVTLIVEDATSVKKGEA